MENNNGNFRIALMFLTLGILIPFRTFSQNISESTISINVTGMIFNDFSLFYEVTRNESKSFGVMVTSAKL